MLLNYRRVLGKSVPCAECSSLDEKGKKIDCSKKIKTQIRICLRYIAIMNQWPFVTCNFNTALGQDTLCIQHFLDKHTDPEHLATVTSAAINKRVSYLDSFLCMIGYTVFCHHLDPDGAALGPAACAFMAFV